MTILGFFNKLLEVMSDFAASNGCEKPMRWIVAGEHLLDFWISWISV
jgi:hypothetical protein